MTSKRRHEDSHSFLRAVDNEIVDGSILYNYSSVLANMTEANDDGSPIPIPCTGLLLNLAVAYYKKFPNPIQFDKNTPLDEDHVSFSVNLDGNTLIALGNLAIFLELDNLASCTCKIVSACLAGKTPTEMQRFSPDYIN